MSSSAFDDVINVTLEFEGGYVDDPADPGGESKFGISKRSYPELDIKALTREEAIAIYRRDFWDRLQLDLLPPFVAEKVFDLSVNVGPHRAVMMLQETLNRLGGNVAVDGVLGPQTRAATASFPEAAVVAGLCRRARTFYITLVRERPDRRKFLDGWLRRAAWNPAEGAQDAPQR